MLVPAPLQGRQEGALAVPFKGKYPSEARGKGFSETLQSLAYARASSPTGAPRGKGLMVHYQHRLVGHARELRKRQTKEERKLWYTFLNSLPVKFVRQKPIGQYIVDFYCAEAKLAIELDGSQHYAAADEGYDSQRNLFLNEQGITVVRYSNLQIARQYSSVKADILKWLGLE